MVGNAPFSLSTVPNAESPPSFLKLPRQTLFTQMENAALKAAPRCRLKPCSADPSLNDLGA